MGSGRHRARHSDRAKEFDLVDDIAVKTWQSPSARFVSRL